MTRSTMVLVLVATLTGPGCSTESPASRSPATPAPAAPNRAVQHTGDHPIHRAGPTELPWTLDLTATGDRRTTTLIATVASSGALRSPVTLTLTEPTTGAIVSGPPEVSLEPGSSGTQKVVWRVNSLAGQYRLVAQQTTHSAGFRSERSWPPTLTARTSPTRETIRPTTSGGLMVHRAVSVD